MYAVVTDANYRMTLALERDLADRGIEVTACYSSEQPPFPARSRAVKHPVRVPDPHTKPVEYVQALYDICAAITKEKQEKPALLPVGTRSLELLSPATVRERFAPVCGLNISSEESLALANDKARLMALCEEIGIPVPKTEHPQTRKDFETYEYPMIVKPVCGEKQGLKAAERYIIAQDAKTAADAWAFFRSRCGETVVQKYIRGQEMGFSAVLDHGRIITTTSEVAVRMLPISGGPGSFYHTLTGDFLRPIAEQLSEKLQLSGVVMFQYILGDDGELVLMEINPRVWGYYPIVREAKSSFSYDWFAVSLGLPTEGTPSKPDVYQYYLPSDAYRALLVMKSGKIGQALRHIGTWLRPRNHEAIWEFSDLRASLGYLSYYLKKSNHQE